MYVDWIKYVLYLNEEDEIVFEVLTLFVII